MSDEQIMGYFLQELTPGAQEEFEAECFGADEWPTQIEEVEQDLIHSYLRNELPTERMRRFEHDYLTTSARRSRVAVMRAVLEKLDSAAGQATNRPAEPLELPHKPAVRSWWDVLRPAYIPALALAALVLVFFTVTTVWFTLRSKPLTTFAQVTLNPGAATERGEETPAAFQLVSLRQEALRVTLNLPAGLKGVQALVVELEDRDGKIERFQPLERQLDAITFVIPARHLARGQSYLIKLHSAGAPDAEHAAIYRFAIE